MFCLLNRWNFKHHFDPLPADKMMDTNVCWFAEQASHGTEFVSLATPDVYQAHILSIVGAGNNGDGNLLGSPSCDLHQNFNI